MLNYQRVTLLFSRVTLITNRDRSRIDLMRAHLRLFDEAAVFGKQGLDGLKSMASWKATLW